MPFCIFILDQQNLMQIKWIIKTRKFEIPKIIKDRKNERLHAVPSLNLKIITLLNYENEISKNR